MKPTLRRLSLALSLALVASGAYAQEFSQVIIFGDSLTDTGRIKEIVSKENAELGNALKPSFTTNDDSVWATILAGYYGKTAIARTDQTPTGTNYAVGGSRSGSIADWTNTDGTVGVKIPTTNEQITQEYLADTQGKTDPNALYVVWIGANDVFYALEQQNPSHVSSAIKATVQDVGILHEKGAKTILVPNIPDLSLTPLIQRNVPLSQHPQVQLLTKVYNSGVFSGLNTLNANIIPANTFALLQEAVANPSGFGLTHTNDQVACTNRNPAIKPTSASLACDKTTLTEDNAGDTHMFADLIHPSGKTHRILAQYYRSLIDSPAQIAQVGGQLAQVGAENSDKLHRNVANLSKSKQSFWADLSGSKDDKPSLLAGVNVGGENHDTGVYLNVNNNEKSVNSHLTTEIKELGVGAYHTHTLGKVQVGVDVGVDKLDVATDRTLDWEGAARTHTGKAGGTRYHAGLTAGVGLAIGKATIRPYVGVNAQKVSLDTIVENNASQSTALQFTLPNQTHTHAKVGLNVSVPMTDKVSVNAGLAHQKQVGGDDKITVASKLSSIGEYNHPYTTTATLAKADSTTAHLGAKVNFGKADLGLGITAGRDDNDSDVGGYMGVQFKF